MHARKFSTSIATKLLATLLVFTATSTAFAREITCVTVEWAPHYGSELLDGGALTVITKQVFRRAGHDTSVSFIPWARAMKNVEEGKNDCVMGAYHNPERAATYLFSDPIYAVDIGLMSLDTLDFKRMSKLEDLKPYTIGVSRGYAQTPEFDSAEFLNKETADSPIQNLRKLFRQRLDIIAGSFDVMRYEAKKAKLETWRLVEIEPPLQSNPLHIMVSRAIDDGDQLIADFNRELAKMQQDGSLDAILKTYLAR